MADNDLLFHNGHRERLREKLLDDKLTSYEKLELLLAYAIPRRDVRPLARTLLKRFRSVYLVFSASYQDLISVPGVGRSTALLICLVRELMLVSYRERLTDVTVLTDMNVIKDYCRRMLTGKEFEEFHVLYLDHDGKLLEDELHSHGDFEQSSILPREIARHALRLCAKSVILVHNHPKSENSFSTPDVNATNAIKQELDFAGVTYIEHFVVTATGVVHALGENPWLNVSNFFK